MKMREESKLRYDTIYMVVEAIFLILSTNTIGVRLLDYLSGVETPEPKTCVIYSHFFALISYGSM